MIRFLLCKGEWMQLEFLVNVYGGFSDMRTVSYCEHVAMLHHHFKTSQL